MSEPWRYRCAACGSVDLKARVRRGGYRCGQCGAIHSSDEIVDAVHGQPVAEVDERRSR